MILGGPLPTAAGGGGTAFKPAVFDGVLEWVGLLTVRSVLARSALRLLLALRSPLNFITTLVAVPSDNPDVLGVGGSCFCCFCGCGTLFRACLGSMADRTGGGGSRISTFPACWRGVVSVFSDAGFMGTDRPIGCWTWRPSAECDAIGGGGSSSKKSGFTLGGSGGPCCCCCCADKPGDGAAGSAICFALPFGSGALLMSRMILSQSSSAAEGLSALAFPLILLPLPLLPFALKAEVFVSDLWPMKAFVMRCEKDILLDGSSRTLPTRSVEADVKLLLRFAAERLIHCTALDLDSERFRCFVSTPWLWVWTAWASLLMSWP